jgi:dUTP pyrophosphatase
LNKVGKFEKVSFDEFKKDFEDTYGEMITKDGLKDIYNDIELPTRATNGSAGYDFKTPFNIRLKPNETMKIPTGIRVHVDKGWALLCYPKSGLGFKCRLQLNNTVGVIDSDYYNSENEGHIFAKITNDSNEGKCVSVDAGDGFMQGIFTPFGITYDDEQNSKQIRNGGFGSTGIK